jgi:predicted aldo/keto reductase-like oxidoreductase
MEDNISFMRDLRPLGPREMDAIAIARAEIDRVPSVPCTSCGYCLPACPQEVAIPGIFEALNLRLVFQSGGGAGFTYKWNTEAHGLQPASACIECGSCEEVCTQHIAIIDELKRARAEFEA